MAATAFCSCCKTPGVPAKDSNSLETLEQDLKPDDPTEDDRNQEADPSLQEQFWKEGRGSPERN